jgi:hypothetical protein
MDQNRALNHHRTRRKTEAAVGWEDRPINPKDPWLDMPLPR